MATIDEALGVAVDWHGEGRLDEAEVLYRRILDADPEQADAWHLLGLLRGQRGEVGRGLALVDRALALRPDRAPFHANRAKLAAALGQDTAGALCRAVRLGQRELAPYLAASGRKSQDKGSTVNALRALTEAVAAGVADAATLFALGDARLDAGRPAPAASAYRATLCDAPDAHPALYNLGVSAFAAGNPGEAERAFARAAVVRPDHLESLDYRTAVLHAAHRLDEAAAQAGALLARKDALAPAAPPLPAVPTAPERRHRNIIAFSLWGTRAAYTAGMVENVRLAGEFYPGWVCRVYHDDSVPPAVLADLDAAGAERVAMPAGRAAVTGTLWRFLASDDPTVARFLCRDADSRLNSRERAAVAEWLASAHPFHVLRDHVLHTEVMLAGLWGGMAGLLPPLAPLIDAYAGAGGDRLLDQRFLRDAVWPRIRNACLVHDSAHPGHGRPFPPVSIDARFAFTHVGASVKSV